MSWEDLINVECKVVFFIAEDLDEYIICKQRLVREYQISDAFGRTLPLWQEATDWFDIDAELLWQPNLHLAEYPLTLEPGQTYAKDMGGGLFEEHSILHHYEHWKTEEDSYYEPGIVYAGFLGTPGRFLERVIWYRKGHFDEGDLQPADYEHPDYQQEATIRGLAYAYSQAQTSTAFPSWHRYLSLSSYKVDWHSDIRAARFHAFAGCPYDPSLAFAELFPYPDDPTSLFFDERIHLGSHPGLDAYPGANSQHHPTLGGWVEINDTDPPGFSAWRATINVPGYPWDSSTGGGVSKEIKRRGQFYPPTETPLQGGVAIGSALALIFLLKRY
jgi:hypothetical protein